MTSPARLTEFATGVGSGVLVDRRSSGAHWVHVDLECPRVSERRRIGVYATERVARAAVSNVKPCPHCRGAA